MRLRCGVMACFVVAGVGVDATAAPARTRFEPTDLNLEDPGAIELDLQVGFGHGEGPAGNRIILPDFELDLGLLPNVELNVDGAFALERFHQATRAYAGEPLWTGVKLGLYDSHDAKKERGIALGLQLGPRLPIGSTMRGIGYGALGLVGFVRNRVRLAFNGGALYDPRDVEQQTTAARLVFGVDLRWSLDARDRFALLGEAGGSYSLNSEPHELSATLGTAWTASDSMTLSIVLLGNALAGGERVSILFGVTPKIQLW